jgi:hypothetical protein
MKRANVQSLGMKEPEVPMAKRAKRSAEESAASLVSAARRFAGDAEDEPQTEEEAAFVANLRNELPRPTAEEIAEIAKGLARRSSER